MTEQERAVYEAALAYGRAVRAYNAICDRRDFPGFGSPEFIGVANAMDAADATLFDLVEPIIKAEGEAR